MRVHITGIGGFLGANLAHAAARAGWRVTGNDSMQGGGGMELPASVYCWPSACQDVGLEFAKNADVIYHCAAAPYEGLSVFSPQAVYEDTLMSSVAVARFAAQHQVRRVVFCSSMARYGRQDPPFTEDMTPAPVDPYGHAKVAAEQAMRSILGLHGVELVTIVPHNIYGPGQRYWDPFRNVAAIMINRVLRGQPPVIYGDGSQVRCLSYVDDVTGPMMAAAAEPVAGQVINVGPEGGVTILELARLILELTGRSDLEPVFVPPRPAEVHTATCSAGKARQLLGYQPSWSLRDGLLQLIKWVEDRGPRPFEYHMPLEIVNDKTPRTWADRLI